MKRTESDFFIAFEELITTFSDDSNLDKKDNEVSGFSKRFLSGLEDLHGYPRTYPDSTDSNSPQESHIHKQRMNKKFSDFMAALEDADFYKCVIPYDDITECVFSNTPTEILDKFTPELKNRGQVYFEENKPKNPEANDYEKYFYKILRHINLAIIQKNQFINIRMKEMDKLKVELQNVKKDYMQLKVEADNQYKTMLTQYISILGIFAAILMGAFGAIQGFSSLFANAAFLNIGKLLIISSLGASSVLLILFFLLNGIAKLTKRNLHNVSPRASTFDKHPTLIISGGILILISFTGAALELSNSNIRFSWYGLWWVLPVIWLLYFGWGLQTKSWIPFLNKKSERTNENTLSN